MRGKFIITGVSSLAHEVFGASSSVEILGHGIGHRSIKLSEGENSSILSILRDGIDYRLQIASISISEVVYLLLINLLDSDNFKVPIDMELDVFSRKNGLSGELILLYIVDIDELSKLIDSTTDKISSNSEIIEELDSTVKRLEQTAITEKDFNLWNIFLKAGWKNTLVYLIVIGIMGALINKNIIESPTIIKLMKDPLVIIQELDGVK